MIKKLHTSLSSLALLLIILSACHAPEVINTVDERGHEMPWTIDITFTPTTVNDTTELYADGIAPTTEGEILYRSTTNEKTGEIEKSSPVHLKKGTWYRTKIIFLNKAGEELNKQFLTEEQAPMHQFFFISTRKAKENDTTPRKIPSQVIYKYADNYRLNGERQPIGFEGVVRLRDDIAYGDFNLRALLVHVTPPATKKHKNGYYYPFDAPGRHLLGVTDMDIQIPIIVEEK